MARVGTCQHLTGGDMSRGEGAYLRCMFIGGLALVLVLSKSSVRSFGVILKF